MKAILDTNVIIDLIRSRRHAAAAISVAGITQGYITTGIFMEVLGGAQLPYKAETRKLLHEFIYIEHLPAIHKLACEWAMKFHFTRSSTTIDFLTGAAGCHGNLPIFTANTKDFRRLPGVQVIPYKAAW